jgi:hypothetical protein
MYPYTLAALAELDHLTDDQVQQRFVAWCAKPLPQARKPSNERSPWGHRGN